MRGRILVDVSWPGNWPQSRLGVAWLAGTDHSPWYSVYVAGPRFTGITAFSAGPSESIRGTPPFDVAFIQGTVGWGGTKKATPHTPNWPTF